MVQITSPWEILSDFFLLQIQCRIVSATVNFFNSSLDSDVGEDEEAAISEEKGVDKKSDFTDYIDDPIVVDEDHGNDTDETAMTNTAMFLTDCM